MIFPPYTVEMAERVQYAHGTQKAKQASVTDEQEGKKEAEKGKGPKESNQPQAENKKRLKPGSERTPESWGSRGRGINAPFNRGPTKPYCSWTRLP